MKKYAIILAGGKGERLGSPLPKQFLPLNGLPTVLYSIKTFQEAIPDIIIILVIPKKNLSDWEEIAKTYNTTITLKYGGETRYQSVKNGLDDIKGGSIIAIHDAARPFISKILIQSLFKAASNKGNAIPGIALKDSIRRQEDNSYVHADRNKLIAIQTPQCFKTEILLKAYEKKYNPSITDDAGLVESIGEEIHIIKGEENNFKITTKQDLTLAELLVQDWKS